MPVNQLAGWVPRSNLNGIPGTSSDLAERVEAYRTQQMMMGQEPIPEYTGGDPQDYLTTLYFTGNTDLARQWAEVSAGLDPVAFNAHVDRVNRESHDRVSGGSDFLGRVLAPISELTRVGRGEVTGVGDFARDAATLGAIGYGTTFLGGPSTGAGTTGGAAPATNVLSEIVLPQSVAPYGTTTAASVGTGSAALGTGSAGTGAVLSEIALPTSVAPYGTATAAAMGPPTSALGGGMALGALNWANIGSSILGLLGSKYAGDKQADAASAAAAGLERADERARADLQPFREAGGAALNPLVDFAMKGPETELERTEGFTNIQNSAAAAGKLRSGQTLKELTSFNNMLNSRNRSQRFNELFNLATLGSNAASRQGTNTLNTAMGVGEFGTQGANAKAAGMVGGINQLNNALENFVFLRALNG